MFSHPLVARIHEADRLIVSEAFEPLIDHYREDDLREATYIYRREAMDSGVAASITRTATDSWARRHDRLATLSALCIGGAMRPLADSAAASPTRRILTTAQPQP